MSPPQSSQCSACPHALEDHSEGGCVVYAHDPVEGTYDVCPCDVVGPLGEDEEVGLYPA